MGKEVSGLTDWCVNMRVLHWVGVQVGRSNGAGLVMASVGRVKRAGELTGWYGCETNRPIGVRVGASMHQ